MRDQLHQEILINDYVVFNPPRYKGVVLGRVIKLNPKSCTIAYGLSGDQECSRDKRYVLKINEQVALAKEKNPEYFI